MTPGTQQTVSIVGVLRDEISTGLRRIRTELGGVYDGARKVAQGLTQFGGAAGSFLGAVSGVAAIRKSVEVADQNERAEARLLAALGGRKKTLQDILKLTIEIDDKTPDFGKEELRSVAATLLNLGVASGKIPAALQASVDVASALNIELETAAREIALVTQGRLGRIGTRVPVLRELYEDGRLAADGLKTLLDLFAGAGTATADTALGRIELAEKAVVGEAEALGRALGDVRAAFVEAFAKNLTGITDFVKSAEFAALRDFVVGLAPLLTKAAIAVAGILTIKALVGVVKSIAGPLLSIATGLAQMAGAFVLANPAAALLAVAVGGIAVATIRMAQESRKYSDELRQQAQLARNVLDDTTATEEERKKARAALIADELEFRGKDQPGLIEQIAAKGGDAAVLKIFNDPAFRSGTQNLEEQARVIRRVATELGIVIDKKSQIVEIDKETEAAAQRADVQRQQNFARFRSETEASEKDLARLAAVDHAVTLALHIEKVQPEEMKRIVSSLNDDLREPVLKIFENAIEEGVKSGAITAERAAELLTIGELPALDRKKQSLDQQADSLRAQLEAQRQQSSILISQLFDLQLAGASAEDRRKAEEATLEAVGAQAETTRDLVTVEKDRAELAERIAAAGLKAKAAQADAARLLVDKAQEARGDLDRQLQAIGEQQKTGAIGNADAINQQNAAIVEFKAKLADVDAQLVSLRERFPEIGVEIDKDRKKLFDLGKGLTIVDPDDFLGGLRQGFRDVSSDLDTLRDLGVQVGRDLTTALSDGLVDVFVRGRTTFQEWLADVLSGVAAILAKFAILKTLGVIPGVGDFLGLSSASKDANGGGSSPSLGDVARGALGLGGTSGGGGGGPVGTLNVTAGTVNVFGGGGGAPGAPGFVSIPGLPGAPGSVPPGGSPPAGAPPDQGGGFLSSIGRFFGFGGGTSEPGGQGPSGGGFGSLLTSLASPFTGLFSGLTGGGGAALSQIVNSFGQVGSGGIGGILDTFGAQGVGGSFSALGALLSGGLGGVSGGLGGLAGLLLSGGGGGLSGLGAALTGGFQAGASGGLAGLLPALTGGFSAGTGAATSAATSALTAGTSAAGGALPFLGPLLQLLTGNTNGALLSGGLTAAGLGLAPFTGGFSLLLPLLGSFFSFADGGLVPGNPNAGDSVHAVLTGQEFVHDVDTTALYGVGAMEAIRSHRVPPAVLRAFAGGGSHGDPFRDGFASGGPVSRVGRGRGGSGVVRAVSVASEHEWEKANAGSDRALIRKLGLNAAEVRSAIGAAKGG